MSIFTDRKNGIVALFIFLAMPMGQMPVLEVDGRRVYQSMAIIRYVAKKVGLAGADDWESLQIDIMADNINDLNSSKTIFQ